tara:strand:+ start:84 stop:185 length:102 start_codon:yes stop_codon:yes gene_type:complete
MFRVEKGKQKKEEKEKGEEQNEDVEQRSVNLKN